MKKIKKIRTFLATTVSFLSTNTIAFAETSKKAVNEVANNLTNNGDNIDSWSDVAHKAMWDGGGWVIIVLFFLAVSSWILELIMKALGKTQHAEMAKVTSIFLAISTFLGVLTVVVNQAIKIVTGG